jgi:excisionase family DNA binding protein
MQDYRGGEPLLHDIPSASRATGLSRATLYRLMDAGAIRPVRVGRSVRIPADELRAFVERLKAEAGLQPVA